MSKFEGHASSPPKKQRVSNNDRLEDNKGHYHNWNKFRQLVPLLTSEDMSLAVGGRLCGSCV